MRYSGEVFDDWLTRTTGIVFVLIVALVIFNIYSDLPEEYPLFRVLLFSLVPVLFIIGGMIFIMSAGAISIILLVIGVYQIMEFLDTTRFYGRLCHQVMYPEYTAHLAISVDSVTVFNKEPGPVKGGEYRR